MKYFTLALLSLASLVHGLHLAAEAEKATRGHETIIHDSGLYKRRTESSTEFEKYQREQEERERQHLMSERDALTRRIMQLTALRDYSVRSGDERNANEYDRIVATLTRELLQLNNRISR